LGFLSSTGYQYGEAVTEEEKHALVMKGTVNFMGFVAEEITPDDEFYITAYCLPAMITDKITDITLGREKEAYADLQPKKFC
jgi:hypothetical protein